MNRIKAAPPGRIRIIGGHWRGRRLTVADTVRPTADRVRETLFNWLTPYLPGAYCLDLFAGTGVLGFEAVSRGAAGAVLVENDPQIALQIRHNRDLLGVEPAVIHQLDARQFLASPPPRRFDIVFVDPPFATDLMPTVLPILAQTHLTSTALIYLEAPREAAIALPTGWRIMREGETRQVRYRLIATGDA